MNADLRAKLDRIQRVALVVGVLGLVGLVVGFLQNPSQFYISYLFAFLMVASLGLGSLSLTMIHYLTGGFWGHGIRRQLQAGIRTLPLIAILFVPIAVSMLTHPEHAAGGGDDGHGGHGAFWLYPWTDHHLVATDHLLQHKAAWLNEKAVLGRAILYFVFWIGVGFALLRNARAWDEHGDASAERRTRIISGPGLVLFSLVTSFAAFDWGMSLEPKWFSTMYGVIYMVGGGLATMAFAIVFLSWVKPYEPYRSYVGRSPGPINLFHDTGTLLFAMVMLWAYTSFSQFLIIWSANIAEETPWYMVRTQTTWQVVALALVFLHFALPFFLLLMRRIKKDASFVMPVAVLLLLMRNVDLYFQTAPALHRTGLHPHWLDLAAPIGLGGIWLAFFLSRFKAYPVTSRQQEHELEAAVGAHH